MFLSVLLLFGFFSVYFYEDLFRFSYFRISILNENEICDAGPQNQPLSVNFFFLKCFPLMYGLLGSDNICLRYNYL